MDNFINSTIRPQPSIDLNCTTSNKLLLYDILKYMPITQYFRAVVALKLNIQDIDVYLHNYTTENIYDMYMIFAHGHTQQNIYQCICRRYTQQYDQHVNDNTTFNDNYGTTYIQCHHCPIHGTVHDIPYHNNIGIVSRTIPITIVILLEQNIKILKYLLDLYIPMLDDRHMEVIIASILSYPSSTTKFIINSIIPHHLCVLHDMMKYDNYHTPTIKSYMYMYNSWYSYRYGDTFIPEKYIYPVQYIQLLNSLPKLNIDRFDKLTIHKLTPQGYLYKNMKEFYSRFSKYELSLYTCIKHRYTTFVSKEFNIPLSPYLYKITFTNGGPFSFKRTTEAIDYLVTLSKLK